MNKILDLLTDNLNWTGFWTNLEKEEGYVRAIVDGKEYMIKIEAIE